MRMLFFLSLMLFLFSCKSKPAKEEAASATWSGQMQGMAGDLKRLLPYLYDSRAFNDPKNREQIKKALYDFSKNAHRIDPGSGKNFIGDPLLLEYSIYNLQDELARASQSFEAGQLDYSRSVAKTSLSSCFRCHSVTNEGASAHWDLDQFHNLTLAPLEKADLLVAARKYEKALVFMDSQLNSPEFYANYGVDFEALLRRYLALLIRVEKDPQRALNALNKILDRGDTPQYVLEQADGWRKSLELWRREKSPRVQVPNDLFTQVDKRFARARTLQSYDKDHAGDVEYLRATTLLHEGMKIVKTPSDQARALYLLGKAYEVLDELGAWNLHENYYESCVRRDPNSPTAKRCFNRLEASLYLGYSGSAGVSLPADERARLEKLRNLVK
jgi:tetratricopeptide (TPR) repeat protein